MGKVLHGYARTPTYNCWANMIARCENPNRPDFHNYGGRGIAVCERWKSFQNFLADMGEKAEGLSLDRIDVDKGYSADNCRWVPLLTQNNNRRDTLWVVINGEALSAKQASERLGVPYERVRWSVQRYGAEWLQYASSASSGVIQRNNKTGVTGVSLHKATGLYHARIERNGRRQSLGYFRTLEEASAVRAAAQIGGKQ